MPDAEQKHKHTPGPLTVAFDTHGGYDCMSAAYVIRGAQNRPLAELDVSFYAGESAHTEHAEAKANAYLFAAAPALYEALRNALALLEEQELKLEADGDLPAEISEARAALALVDGAA